jgi:cytochrome c
MKIFFAGLAAAAWLAAGPTLAATPEELLKTNACTSCHAVDKKLVGPAYNEVAAKYRGQQDAEAKLFEKVKKGGVGVWGQLPMPPNAAVKDDDLHAMLKYILSLK